MANQGEMLPNHPVHVDVQAQAGRHDHRHYNLLDAARALMMLGVAAAVSTVCNPDADAAQGLSRFHHLLDPLNCTFNLSYPQLLLFRLAAGVGEKG